MTRRAAITATRFADANNVVHCVHGGRRAYRRTPCVGCPWLVRNAGSFPAEAFRISVGTSYDAAFEQFACHESGTAQPAICAGFLLRNAANNIGTRLAAARGDFDHRDLIEPADVLWSSYRAMAIGNGVDPGDPILARCRSDDE